MFRPFAILALIAWTTSFLVAQVPSPGGTPTYRIRIVSGQAALLAAQLEASHYDVLGQTPAGDAVELAVSVAELQALQAASLAPQVVETAGPLALKLGGGAELPVGYRDLAGIEAAMQAAAAAHPGLARVVDVSAISGTGPTHEGRSLKALVISDNVDLDEDEPEVLIVGLHHAREIVTPEICLDHADRLLAGYGSDPAITAIVDAQRIWIVPVVNPDGLVEVWTSNNLWRKNRSPQAGGEIGVDINRNYDLGWSSSCAGSTAPSNETYKGPAPFSEVESRTLRDLSRRLRFAKVLDFHSYGREVLLGYDCSAMPASQSAFIAAEGGLLASAAGYQTRLPSADGEHPQWQIKETSCYSYLVETQVNFQPSYVDALAEAAQTWPLTRAFLAREIPVVGHVSDALNGNPVAADVTVVGLNWQQGESRQAEARFGRYHLFLPTGMVQLQFSRPGYQTQTVPVMVPASGQVQVDVALVPINPDLGQANRYLASLEFSGAIDWNGAPAGSQNGPFFATYAPGDAITIDFQGPPLRPFFLLAGGLNRNNAVGLVGSLDIGFLGTSNDFSDLVVVLNGVAPLSFFDQLAFLSGVGRRRLVVPAPPGPGLQLGAFQAWIHQDQGLPLLSAATELSTF